MSNRNAHQDKLIPSAAELRQVAALPTRLEGGNMRICLITTRETARWTVPKGWPMKGLKDHAAAAVEAAQEAGLEGKIEKKSFGEYLYWKRREEHFDLIRVAVYRMSVSGQMKHWPEMDQREVRWFSPHEAAAAVDEPGLSEMIASLGA